MGSIPTVPVCYNIVIMSKLTLQLKVKPASASPQQTVEISKTKTTAQLTNTGPIGEPRSLTRTVTSDPTSSTNTPDTYQTRAARSFVRTAAPLRTAQQAPGNNQHTSSNSRYASRSASSSTYHSSSSSYPERVKKAPKPTIFVKKTVDIFDQISALELANNMCVNIKELIRSLRKLGINVKTTDKLDLDSAQLIVEEYKHTPKILQVQDVFADPVADLTDVEVTVRPPIVAIVGHVDHGKTSLLDVIRNTNVVEGESGGITQHIGAYQVMHNSKRITFLDTPGHEAFANMRENGIDLTDIVLLVIAADDGIKAQTVEAIKYVQNSTAQVIVVITKVDKPTANPDKVLEQLLSYSIITEKHSGNIPFVLVSSKTKFGIDSLLETILLQADVMDLKARTVGHGIGICVETNIRKGFGYIANVIIQAGTLKIGDNFVLGNTYGKVKCLIDEHGKQIDEARVSMPVSVIGLEESAQANTRLVVVPNEQLAKYTATERKQVAQSTQAPVAAKALAQLFATDQTRKLLVLLKSDTVGTLDAVKLAINQIKNPEVEVEVIYSDIGQVSEKDIDFARTSQAIIVTFNLAMSNTIAKIAAQKSIHIMQDRVIYKLLEGIQELIDSMMRPVIEEITLGTAQVIALFRKDTIAGCRVLNGKISNGDLIKITRNGDLVVKSRIRSLEKSGESVTSAGKDQECAIMIDVFHGYMLGDTIECYEEVQRKPNSELNA